MPALSVLGGHLRGKTTPSWLDEEHRRTLDSPLFHIAPGAELADFELPCDEGEAYFPCLEGASPHEGGRWYVTMTSLNDPPYGVALIRELGAPYPTPWVLAIIVLTAELAGCGVKIPIVKDPAKQQVYDMADTFARRLGAPESSKGQLAALKKLARVIPAGPFSCEESWLDAYAKTEALLLTLSMNFEEAHDNWRYADDPERISGACASLITAFASVLLHPPSESSAQRLADEKDYLRQHLEACSLTLHTDDEGGCRGFEEMFPEAAATWELLLKVGELVLPGADATSAAAASGRSKKKQRVQ
jgi:hypothetical protein